MITKEQKEQVIEMNNRGWSYSEIAGKLNLTRNKVAGIIWRHRNPGKWKKEINYEMRNQMYGNKRHIKANII